MADLQAAHSLAVESLVLHGLRDSLAGWSRCQVDLRSQNDNTLWLSVTSSRVCWSEDGIRLPPASSKIGSALAHAFRSNAPLLATQASLPSASGNSTSCVQLVCQLKIENLEALRSERYTHLLVRLKQALREATYPKAQLGTKAKQELSSLLKQLALDIECLDSQDHSQVQQLYDTVIQTLHTVLDQPEASPGRTDVITNTFQLLAHLQAQADGAEAAGDVVAASRYHLERCTIAPTNLQVWLDYGLMSARHSNHGRAQQCFREILAIEPGHNAANSPVSKGDMALRLGQVTYLKGDGQGNHSAALASLEEVFRLRQQEDSAQTFPEDLPISIHQVPPSSQHLDLTMASQGIESVEDMIHNL
ncbi:hypothetical protein WJX84_010870 [Apatococcus fuscideae]|uniref:Uncharacterized protein n=1 Tax=Apatococcus fuscideae TaxID=2026836 RepID=A0AAW1S845_9CHLO